MATAGAHCSHSWPAPRCALASGSRNAQELLAGTELNSPKVCLAKHFNNKQTTTTPDDSTLKAAPGSSVQVCRGALYLLRRAQAQARARTQASSLQTKPAGKAGLPASNPPLEFSDPPEPQLSISVERPLSALLRASSSLPTPCSPPHSSLLAWRPPPQMGAGLHPKIAGRRDLDRLQVF